MGVVNTFALPGNKFVNEILKLGVVDKYDPRPLHHTPPHAYLSIILFSSK